MNDLKKSDMWKIQLAIAITFISFKDCHKKKVMHLKSANIEIMILNNDKANEVIPELFQSLLSRHQIGFETSIKVSDIVFDCVHLLYYKYHQTNPNRGDHI